MSTDAEFEIQRRLLNEFERLGWQYDLLNARRIAKVVTRDQVTEPAKLAKLVTLSALARSAPTRSQVAAAISRALTGLTSTVEGSERKMHVLFVSAGPSDEVTLRLDAEHRDIQRRIKASSNRNQVTMSVALAARPTDLIDALNQEKPSVLHISGHASSATGLAFENDEGKAVDVSGDQLMRLVAFAGPALRLVVLNSCESATHAQPLTKHVEASIGMTRSIEDEAALAFAAQLYASLAEGVPLGRAMAQACLQISLAGLSEDQQPKLFGRPGIDLDALTLT